MLFQERYRVSSALRAEGILQEMADTHILCTLLPEGSALTCSTMVLESDRDGGIVRMDGLRPGPGDHLCGKTVQVLARAHGIVSGFAGVCQSSSRDELLLRYPDTLYQLQRRRLFRVPLAAQDPDLVEIHRQGAQSVQGCIQDISAGGLRVFARIPADYPFSSGEELPQISFSLRGGHPVRTAAELRHVGGAEAGLQGRGQVLGVAFLRVPKNEAEQIARYVHIRDREILQALGRGLPGSGKRAPPSLRERFKRWWES